MKTVKLHETNNSPRVEVKRLKRDDLRSPLGTLKMVYESGKFLQLRQNIDAAENVTNRIDLIIDNLLNSTNKIFANVATINLHNSIAKILVKKDMEYCNANVDFYYSYTRGAEKKSIYGSINAFECMLSNLIDNAIEACNFKAKECNGIVMINLLTSGSKIFLTIGDNGKGMSLEVLEKLRNGVAVTNNKGSDNGIDFIQIRDTIRNLNALFDIESRIGEGTTLTISFENCNHE